MKTYKYKLYHSKKSKFLNEQTRICGKIYNHCIGLKYRYYKMYKKSLNKYQLQKHLTKLKKLDKYSHWNKVGSQAIQEITDRIEKGYQAFFKNCKIKSSRKVGIPTFKSSYNYSSFTLKQAGYKVLPLNQVKIGKRIYKYHKSREIKGEIKCVTVKKDRLGDFYICFTCKQLENNSNLKSMTGETAGFDFGCTDFLVKNDGTKIKSPLFFKQSKKLVTKASQVVSKKTKGSNNHKSAKRRLAKLHDKIANQRRDFHFKLANKLCSEYDIMLFETLDIESMKKEHGKKINDLGFSDFMTILEYKALEYGKTIHHVDKWFASTKLCNVCGYKNKDLTVRDRTWECPECTTFHDRDINASINISNQGLKDLKRRGHSPVGDKDVSLCESKAVLA